MRAIDFVETRKLADFEQDVRIMFNEINERLKYFQGKILEIEDRIKILEDTRP